MDEKFFDLNVSYNCEEHNELLCMFKRLLECGYCIFGLTTKFNLDLFTYETDNDSDSRKKNKVERRNMIADIKIKMKPPDKSSIANILDEAYKSLPRPPSYMPKFFTRLNLAMTDTTHAGLFFKEFNNEINKFDIISIEPKTFKALTFACEDAPIIDLITIDIHTNFFNEKQLNITKKKGIYWEINYGALFSENAADARTSLASFFTNLASRCRTSIFKRFVISSGAKNAWNVRRPLSIISILKCFQVIGTEDAIMTMKKNPFAALYHGLSAKHSAHGAAILVNNLKSSTTTVILDEKPKGESAEPPCKKIKTMK